MIGDFSQANKTETHTKAQETSRAGNIADPGHFLRFAKSLGVGFFDKDVDDSQIFTGIFMNFTFNGFGDGFIIECFCSPTIVFVAVDGDIGYHLKGGAEVGVVGGEG